jgi:hypothetical protein
MTGKLHRATFNVPDLDMIQRLADVRLPEGGRVLDPYVGVGTVHRVEGFDIFGSDIEEPYVREAPRHPLDLVADAEALPFADGTFAAIMTSPTFGNRMADYFHAKDNSRRNSYVHALRDVLGDPDYELHPHNTARGMYFDGPASKYCRTH